MRYSARTLVIPLVVAAALPIMVFPQSVARSQTSAETASNPNTTSQWREIVPGQALSFVLDRASGVAYFTSVPSGLRLVATVKGSWGPPIRFVTTLAPDQTATVSVPRIVGEAPVEVSFLRQGEMLVVKTPSPQ